MIAARDSEHANEIEEKAKGDIHRMDAGENHSQATHVHPQERQALEDTHDV